MTGENIRAQAREGDWGDHADAKFWHNDFKRVKQIIDDMQPNMVESAASVYDSVSKRIESTMDVIYREAQRLTQNWAGQDANAAMQQMQKAYTAAHELHQASGQSSGALTQYAQHQRDWQQQVGGVMAGIMGSDVGTVANMASPLAGMNNNDGADQMMHKIQQETVSSNSRFPDGIGADMPLVHRGGVTPVTNPGPGGGTPDMSGAGPGAGQIPGGGSPSQLPGGTGAGHLPGGGQLPGGGGTDLAGYTPPGGGGSGGLGGGLGAGGLGAGGAGIGGLGSGAGGGPGAGGVVGGFPGVGAGAAGASAAGKPGMGGMGGGMGGGRGGEEEERERTTWLAEDEDIWSGDDGAAPPVIG